MLCTSQWCFGLESCLEDAATQSEHLETRELENQQSMYFLAAKDNLWLKGSVEIKVFLTAALLGAGGSWSVPCPQDCCQTSSVLLLVLPATFGA